MATLTEFNSTYTDSYKTKGSSYYQQLMDFFFFDYIFLYFVIAFVLKFTLFIFLSFNSIVAHTLTWCWINWAESIYVYINIYILTFALGFIVLPRGFMLIRFPQLSDYVGNKPRSVARILLIICLFLTRTLLTPVFSYLLFLTL